MSATTNTLRKKIEGLESDLEKTRRSKAAAEEKLAGLNTKRKGYVRQAALGDAEAQKSLAEIENGITTAERELGGCNDAVGEISAEIEERKDDLALADWEDRRDRVRAMVEAYAGSDKTQRMGELVRQLLTLLKDLAEEERKVSNAIHEFEPRRMFGKGPSDARRRFEWVCSCLNHGGWDFYRWREISDVEAGYSSQAPQRLLKEIDQLEA